MEEKGRGGGIFVLGQRDKGLPLDGEEARVAHRAMAVDKGKTGSPMLDEVFDSYGVFDCWAPIL